MRATITIIAAFLVGMLLRAYSADARSVADASHVACRIAVDMTPCEGNHR